ncbi:hypothetical protein AU14_12670 [Marinobacter similis]|uniref:Uncharacterized protein n=1 Tax=Marinobacter similis TaxID=1420916 RepID=W5YM70_9GAMM|nr:hypothetical protein AU14_12670 [Marinobacter similis]
MLHAARIGMMEQRKVLSNCAIYSNRAQHIAMLYSDELSPTLDQLMRGAELGISRVLLVPLYLAHAQFFAASLNPKAGVYSSRDGSSNAFPLILLHLATDTNQLEAWPCRLVEREVFRQ